MKKVKDFINGENSFFKNFQRLQPSSYAVIFGDANPAELDLSLSIIGGGRYASPLITEHKIEDVVMFINMQYYNKWVKYKELLALDYNVLNPYEQKKTTTQEKTGENINTVKESEVTSVHTFDSTDAIDKDIESVENTDTTTESENVKITVETSGNVGNIAPTKLIIEEMKMRATQLNDLVMKDIIKEISLDIY